MRTIPVAAAGTRHDDESCSLELTGPAWRCVPGRWPDAGRFAVAWLALSVAFVAVGAVLVHGLAGGVLGELDPGTARWCADERTPTLEDMAQVGAGLADAFTVIPFAVAASVVFVVVWKRWNETILL